jgi:Spy/CpxP family protein refolding chaperone
MQKKWLAVGGLAVLGAVAAYATPMVAHARGLIDGGERIAHLRSMVADLNLTDTQKQQIKEIVGNAAPQIQPIVKEIERNHLALRAATENHYDAARVRVIADRQGKLVSDLTVDGARVKAQIFGVLSPEQRAKAEAEETRVEEFIAGVHYGDIVNAVLQ